MTTETILTDDQILRTLSIVYGCSVSDVILHDAIAARRIEQAVLQSLQDKKEKQHPDAIAVDEFATAMKAKLAKKRAEGREGWQDMSAGALSELLHGHIEKGDPLDVANFCMMLHQNGQPILQSPEVQALRKDAVSVRRDTLLSVLGKLNSNPYNLMKSECIDVVREMFEEADAAREQQHD